MRKVSYKGIPKQPSEFLKNRTLTNSLGKAEAEEFFGRALRFCVARGRWVSITAEELYAQVHEDLEVIRKAEEIRERNREKRKLYEKKARWNWLRKLFGIEVIMEPTYEEELEIPITTVMLNPDAMNVGAEYMRKNGFLRIYKEGETTIFKITKKALLAMPIVG